MADFEKLIKAIAETHFHVETLDTRNLDRLDFHDVHVASMRAALLEAFKAGCAYSLENPEEGRSLAEDFSNTSQARLRDARITHGPSSY